MRLYEIVYIFDPDLGEAEVTAKVEELHKLLTQNGGEVVTVDHWGSRQLAYPINKQKTGYYLVVHVRTEADALPDFERKLRLDDSVMRYLIVVNEGEPVDGVSLVIERPVRESEDDDDDDDDRGKDGPEATGDDDEDDESEERRGPPEFSGGMGRRRRMDGPAIDLLNYKDVATLSRFMTEQGKILPKRTTKVPARLQRQLGRAIKRARYLALVPYVRDHEV